MSTWAVFAAIGTVLLCWVTSPIWWFLFLLWLNNWLQRGKRY